MARLPGGLPRTSDEAQSVDTGSERKCVYNRRVSALSDALAAVSRRVPKAFRLLRTWVETNSHTGVPENVNAMGELLKQAFGLPELVSSVQAGCGFGDHLAWHTPDAAGAPRVVLVGHHDTVFPPGSFEGWHEDGELIRGPGVLDMKGGIAVVWCALGALRLHCTAFTGGVVSKRGAGEYGLTVTPPALHPVLHTALAMRAAGEHGDVTTAMMRDAAAVIAWCVADVEAAIRG